MATTRGKRAEPGLPDRADRPRASLLGTLLSGLVRSPAGGGELGHARQGVAALKLVDGVLEVAPGIDAEDEAVVDQGVGHRETFTAAHGAGEEKVSAPDSVVADSSFGPAVVDLECTVAEAAAEKDSMVDGVGCGPAQRGLGQEGGMRAVDPGIQLVQDGQGAHTADLAAGLRIDTAGLALGLDEVEVGKEFKRDDGTSIFGEQCGVKLGSDV